MSIEHEAASVCRSWVQPGSTFPVAELSRKVLSVGLCHSKGNHRQTCCHFLFWYQDRGLLGEEEAKGKGDMKRNSDGEQREEGVKG